MRSFHCKVYCEIPVFYIWPIAVICLRAFLYWYFWKDPYLVDINDAQHHGELWKTSRPTKENLLEYYRSALLRLDNEELIFYHAGMMRFRHIPFRHAQSVRTWTAYEFDDEVVVAYQTLDLSGATLYCRYFDEQGRELGKPSTSFAFPDFAVICPKRSGTRKMTLSARPSSYPDEPIALVPKKSFAHFLSMCLAPIYGDEPKWLMLIELFEHYKLQGVSHFYVYVIRMSRYDQKVLRHYANSSTIEVIYIDDDKRPPEKWKLPAIRECSFRSRHESKWTIFADLDERLLMSDKTIHQYLTELPDESLATLMFRQRWVMKYEQMPATYDPNQVKKLMPSNRLHVTTSIGPPHFNTKCIVDTAKVYGMNINMPSHEYPGYELIELRPEEGYARHYRDVHLGEWADKYLKLLKSFGPFSLTNYPEDVRVRLEELTAVQAMSIFESSDEKYSTAPVRFSDYIE